MKHHCIDYVEFPAAHIDKTQRFFEQTFGWQFTAYGPEYVAFHHAGLTGGFYLSELTSQSSSGGALIVMYSERLEETMRSVEHFGGVITKPIFSFPGGRRFQFQEPSGNELAVWSDR
ncbi:Glyoxalase family protein [Pseudoalteromonas luteoviolacea B = ATCC 29581]|nr:Glyoxalase family protein [Pseudoalteromonas luteoviolacea B = ATCC 29581]